MTGNDELDELAKEIKRNIEDNKRFIGRIMSEDFEPDEDDEIEPDPVEV